MARATTPRARKTAQNDTAKAILESLKRLSAIKENDTPQSRNVLLNEGWLVLYNGILAGALKVDAGVNCYVNRKLLESALAHVGKKLAMTVLPTGDLVVQSGDYHSVVPGANPAEIIPTPPDANVYAINDAVRTALVRAGRLAADSAQEVHHASVLLNGQTVVGTNNRALVESWHGYQLPVGTPLPKIAVTALDKYGDTLAGFGMGIETVTFHFADGGYIRSQFYNAPWPEQITGSYANLFEGQPAPATPPKGFFDAVRQVQPFGHPTDSGGEIVLLRQEMVQTHEDAERGASIAVKGLFDEGAFNARDLLALEDLCHTIIIAPGRFIGFSEDGLTRCVASGFNSLPSAVTGDDPLPESMGGAPVGEPQAAAAPEWGQGRAQWEMEQMAGTDIANTGTPASEPQTAGTGPFVASASPSSEGAGLGNVPFDMGTSGGDAPFAGQDQPSLAGEAPEGAIASPSSEAAPWTTGA